jgi:hypothetical protein
MKTAAIVLAAALAAALCFSTPRGDAAPYTAPKGSYMLTATNRNDVFLLDSATGAVWVLTPPQTLCLSDTKPAHATPADNGSCEPGSTAVSVLPAFQRVSVDGLYTTPYDKATSITLGRVMLGGSAKH